MDYDLLLAGKVFKMFEIGPLSKKVAHPCVKVVSIRYQSDGIILQLCLTLCRPINFSRFGQSRSKFFCFLLKAILAYIQLFKKFTQIFTVSKIWLMGIPQ